METKVTEIVCFEGYPPNDDEEFKQWIEAQMGSIPTEFKSTTSLNFCSDQDPLSTSIYNKVRISYTRAELTA